MIRLSPKDLLRLKQRLKIKDEPKKKKEQPDEYMFVNSPCVKNLKQTWVFIDLVNNEKE